MRRMRRNATPFFQPSLLCFFLHSRPSSFAIGVLRTQKGQLRGNGGWISSQRLSPRSGSPTPAGGGRAVHHGLPSIIPRETYIPGFRSTHLHDANFARADSLPPTPPSRPPFLFRSAARRENEVKDAKRDRARR